MNLPLGKRGHWIGGEERPARSGRSFEVYDPGNGQVLGHAARGDQADAEAAVSAATRALCGPWAQTGGWRRGQLLRDLAVLLERDRPHLCRILSLENGKPLSLAGHEVDMAIRYCRYYAGFADRIAGRQIPLDGGHFAFTLREPLGVILLITPWNYPLDILARGFAPALAAGNTVVTKTADDTPFIALEVGRQMKEAGFPDGVFNVVDGLGAEAGAALSAHPGIHGVSFCGSSATGSRVAAAAAANLVPVLSLELGGKCPCLVLPDADVRKAARGIANGLIYNAGQSCVARSRFIIPRQHLTEVESIMHEVLDQVPMGHSQDNPAMGPIINRAQLEKVQSYIATALAEGGRLVVGGPLPAGLPAGHFVRPHVFADLDETMTIVREEVFGPVLAIQTYGEEEEGIRLANNTPYGLAAELWAATPARAHGVARRLNASHITINSSGGFGIEVPFGGIGQSGYGREGGEEGLWQYTRTKSVYMDIEE